MRRRSAAFCLCLLLAGCTVGSRTGQQASSAHTSRDAMQRGAPPEDASGEAASSSQGGGAPSDEDVAASASAHDGHDEGDEEEGHDDEGELDDDDDLGPAPDATFAPPHPFEKESDAELERRLVEDRGSLGSISVGRPNGGRLVGGVQMQPADAWTIVAPGQAWGTEETIRSLETAIHAVRSAFPGTSPIPIGDISGKGGGYFRPHLSHQSGRDVDLGYYYLGDQVWYRRASAKNLDAARTWALVRAFVTLTDVELILIDRSLQPLLREHAEKIGEDRGWLELLFRGRGGVPAMIRHAPGHATHLHVRFYSPAAQETGRRLYPALVRYKIIQPGAAYFTHRARKGDTLGKLAKRYRTTVRAIMNANGLRRSNLIQAKKTYKIPRTGHTPVSIVGGPVKIPPRRLPPNGPGPLAPPAAVAENLPAGR